MGRYLEIADRALSEMPTLASTTHCEKSELSERSLQSVDELSKKYRESRDEVQREAGDDWAELSADPAKLIAFADLLATSQIRESGKIPDTYTATTNCRSCGSVPIFEGCPPQVNGCPWCFNRIDGLPTPADQQ